MRNTSIKNTIAVMAVYFLTIASGAVSPALQSIAEAFPHVSFPMIGMVLTMPVITMIPFSIISGAIAGNRMKYRTVAAIGIFLFVVAGTIPCLLDSFPAILVCRAITGIGLGLISPLGNALVLRLFPQDQGAKLIGIGNLIMNAGSICFMMLASVLCEGAWQKTFLVHLLGVIPLIIVLLMLTEPEKIITDKHEKVKLPAMVWWLCLVFGICVMCIYPVFTAMSGIIITSGIGNAVTAGAIIALVSVGGMISGALFGKIYPFAGRYTMSLSTAIGAVGMGIVYFGTTLPVLAIGTLFIGIGFTMCITTTMMNVGSVTPPAGVSLGAGMVMAAMSVGGFVSTYYVDAIGKVSGQTAIEYPFLISTIGLLAVAVICIFVRVKNSNVSPAQQ